MKNDSTPTDQVSAQRAVNGAEARAVAELRLHDEASLVPDMSAEEYAGFRASVAEHGILVPIEATSEGVVLDGRARLQAARKLGLESVPVRIVAARAEVGYMVRAALERRQLSASQKAALVLEWSAYEELLAEGRKRQRQNLRQNAEVASVPPRGKTRELLAEIAGVSERTVQDVIAAYEGDRELFERVKEGTIAAPLAARRVRRARRDRALPPAPPLPGGPFEIVYADPPWQLGNPDGPYAPENHYPTMPLSEIKALAVPAAENALLFLWAVNCLLPQALEVLEAWGFEYVTNLVWVKPSIGLGRWARNRHELLLVGREGTFPAPELEDLPDSVMDAGRGRHSEKPALVYELIERMYPRATKVELFARGSARAGWTAWGDEAEEAEPSREPR